MDSNMPPGISVGRHGSALAQAGQQGSGTQQQQQAIMTIVKAQIAFLLGTLADDNWLQNRDEIHQVKEKTPSSSSIEATLG